MAANTFSGGDLGNVARHAAYITVDGVAIGYTQDGIAFLNAIGLTPIQFNEDAIPQGKSVDTQEVTIDVTLAEVTLENIKKYLGGLAEISGSALYYGNKKGSELTLYTIKVFFLHNDADHEFYGKVLTFHKATIEPNGALEINPTSSGFEGLPVKITAQQDLTQSAGRELWSIAAVDTAAPTVSTVVPADAATGIAVDADIVITFSKAMGLSSFVENETVLIVDDAKSSNAFTEVVNISGFSLNAAKTVMTISHADDDFSASNTYRVILTNVRSADGVALAAPYIWEFTTTS